jgi:hypothetical protein
MNTRVDESKVPCITVAIQSSNETAATLGDVNYDTVEQVHNLQRIKYYDLSLSSYNAVTGACTVPASTPVEVFVGEYVKTVSGNLYPVLDVSSDVSFKIATGIVEQLTHIQIVASQISTVTLESLEFRETGEIGCHVHSEPIYLTYLWSIVMFVLLRYKEELIEGRGYERTTLSSTGIVLNTGLPISQPVYTRMINISGYVRQYWPKFFRGPVEGVTGGNLGFIRPINPITDLAVPIFADDPGT